jgi:hypothetical protein
MLSSFLHPEKGYKDAAAKLKEYYDKAQANVQPYNQNGQDQYKNLQSYIDNLMHPEKLQDEWIKNYHESEAAKQNETMAQEHGLNAASSMGLGGSNTALNAIQAGTSQIGNQDRQQYLNDLMEKYKTGAGLSSGVYNTGAGAATTQSNNNMNMGQNTAQLQYNQTNAPGTVFGQGASMIQDLIRNYLSGGK